MKKYLMLIKIKSEMRNEYIKIHKGPWREIPEAIRESGLTYGNMKLI